MQLKLNVWIENDGQVALSLWRVALLEAIAETGSINAAAAKMNISYRRAWDKIRESEHQLGTKLVETHVGGTGGGGSQLTAAGNDYVNRFRQLTAGLTTLAQRRFRQTFCEIS